MENRVKKELERKRLIIQSVLCALLPPVGMLLVWRSRHPGRRKLMMTLCSTLVLMLMFCVGLALQEPEEIRPPVHSAGFAQTQDEAEPEQDPYIQQPEITPAPEIIDDTFVAPANPNG